MNNRLVIKKILSWKSKHLWMRRRTVVEFQKQITIIIAFIDNKKVKLKRFMYESNASHFTFSFLNSVAFRFSIWKTPEFSSLNRTFYYFLSLLLLASVAHQLRFGTNWIINLVFKWDRRIGQKCLMFMI